MFEVVEGFEVPSFRRSTSGRRGCTTGSGADSAGGGVGSCSPGRVSSSSSSSSSEYSTTVSSRGRPDEGDGDRRVVRLFTGGGVRGAKWAGRTGSSRNVVVEYSMSR